MKQAEYYGIMQQQIRERDMRAGSQEQHRALKRSHYYQSYRASFYLANRELEYLSTKNGTEATQQFRIPSVGTMPGRRYNWQLII